MKRAKPVRRDERRSRNGGTWDLGPPRSAEEDEEGLGWEEIETGEGSDEAAGGRSLPAEMRCFDRAKVFVKAGDGGDGATAFRREACVPQGGPAGGNGGDGGGVYVVGDAALTSLYSFRKQLHFRAGRGGNGTGANCYGRGGGDVTLHVPLGTLLRDAESGELLAEVLSADEPRLVLAGGRGGRGNASFKSNRNRAPMLSEKGEAGLELWLRLELQVVADVGIVGMPNAGKSSLLARLSSARPRVASYAFTTLVPNLGVCQLDYATTVFADIPGLVEGAHLGVGLGHQFLRHCLRCRVLVHVLDGGAAAQAEAAGEGAAARALIGAFHAIQTELAAFSPALATKPQLVVLNKLDLGAARRCATQLEEYFAARGCALHLASAASGEGVEELVRAARRLLAEQPAPAAPPPPLSARERAAPLAAELAAAREADLSSFTVVKDGDAYVVEGAALGRFVQMTNWEFFEAVQRFSFVMKKVGVWAALRAAGVKEGDTVVIGSMEMAWEGAEDEGRLYDNWRKSGLAGPTRGARHWPHPN